jgi:hypothetical protein
MGVSLVSFFLVPAERLPRLPPTFTSVLGLSTRFLWELEESELVHFTYKSCRCMWLGSNRQISGKNLPAKDRIPRLHILSVFTILPILPRRNKPEHAQTMIL